MYKHIIIIFLVTSCLFAQNFTFSQGAIVRGDTSKKQISLVFTGHEYSDGGEHILNVLNTYKVPGTFFFTGKFYKENEELIRQIKKSGHYLGPHSYDHLLYCSWENRDSLLVTKDEFIDDLNKNYQIMKEYGIEKANIFLPPYEWYNQQIADWCNEIDITLINMSHGTLSHTDYTFPSMKRYWSSDTIYKSIIEYEETSTNGLNGFILLVHIGTNPERTDKFYFRLEELIMELQDKEYEFIKIKVLVKGQ